jgi:AbiV family abortive infection protein
VLTNAKRLEEAAKRLHKDGRVQASEVLDNVAAEEAAKFMILIDAVRCPKSELGRQLSWFNHHLAKGIYSEYYETRPATFGEVRQSVERWRPTLYLDGPNDVDFILRNYILQRREERLYVDYVESEGDHYWHNPEIYDTSVLGGSTPAVLSVADDLFDTGVGKPAALAVLAEFWRPIQIHDDLHWSEYRLLNIRCFEKLESFGLLEMPISEVRASLTDQWLYPLYLLDLREQQIERRLLEDQRRSWTPEI